MTRLELSKKLKAYKIPESDYSLNGGLPNEAFCISGSGNEWFTYYSERGVETSLKSFDNENDACIYFFNWIKESISFES